MMRMLCTLLTPTSGTATIAGYDLLSQQESVRKTIGYVSQVGGMEREASGRENLLLQARLYGMSGNAAQARITDILRFLQLESFANRRTTSYSGGQRRIFDLASGIVHEPQLLCEKPWREVWLLCRRSADAGKLAARSQKSGSPAWIV